MARRKRGEEVLYVFPGRARSWVFANLSPAPTKTIRCIYFHSGWPRVIQEGGMLEYGTWVGRDHTRALKLPYDYNTVHGEPKLALGCLSIFSRKSARSFSIERIENRFLMLIQKLFLV